jgi:hypothetical protein
VSKGVRRWLSSLLNPLKAIMAGGKLGPTFIVKLRRRRVLSGLLPTSSNEVVTFSYFSVRHAFHISFHVSY